MIKMKMVALLKPLFVVALLLLSASSFAQQAFNDRLKQLVASGDYPDALEMIAEAKQKEGADQVALDLLKGAVLVRMGRHEEGMALFKALAEKEPNDAALFNNIGVIHAEKGELEEARQAFERALEISPKYQQALFNLGDVYAELACRTYGNIPQEVAKGVPTYCEPVDRSVRSAASTSTPPPVARIPVAAKQPEVDGRRNQVLQVVSSWRDAWAAQDVPAYLGHYSSSFEPIGMNIGQWKRKRERSLTRPSWIKIELSNPRVEFTQGQAKVELKQRYRSNTYRDAVTKQLVLVQEEGAWRIVREQAF